jgi:3-mercaptopyruvate sulfurtransferase SseA
MRFVVSGAVAIMGAVLLLAGCNSNDASGTSKASNDPGKLSTSVPGDGVRRITVTELKNAIDKKNVFVVDVREPQAYEVEHITGSINIPAASTGSRVSELPRDKMIVTYCT